jgi:PilZ domain-containing protein
MHSNAVLAEVTCTWGSEAISAAVVHSARDMLVLEATDPAVNLPSIGTTLQVSDGTDEVTGRLAEHGRGGRFLVSIGDRPVRRSLRLKVSLPATLRCRALPEPKIVEIVDLTPGGARIRGLELAVGTSVTLDFTPPYRREPVSVRATVAHGTHGADRPWIGVVFRLVALRGGR